MAGMMRKVDRSYVTGMSRMCQNEGYTRAIPQGVASLRLVDVSLSVAVPCAVVPRARNGHPSVES